MPMMLMDLFRDSMQQQVDQILWRKVEAMPPWARCILFGHRTVLGLRWYEDQGIWPEAMRTGLYVQASHAFYDSHEWRAFRSRFLSTRPTCEFHGCTQPATIVHHVPPSNVAATVIELGFLWALEEDVESTRRLQALCNPHHKYVHGLL